MSVARFSVSYEIVTPESAEVGDYDEIGMVIEDASLREAVDAVAETRTAMCDGVENVDLSGGERGWSLTVFNGMEFETGARESRTLHIPETVTAASAGRILLLVAPWRRRR